MDKMDKYSERRFDVQGENHVDSEVLETVDYTYPGRRTEIEIVYPEFTSVCPWTGLPDFGTITITYVPGSACVELKSLKYYLNSFRNVGILQEHVVNRVLDDLTEKISPLFMTVTGEFNARGGLSTVLTASYPQE